MLTLLMETIEILMAHFLSQQELLQQMVLHQILMVLLTINGAGTYDAMEPDATGGNVTFTGAGSLELGSTVTSLGTFGGYSKYLVI